MAAKKNSRKKRSGGMGLKVTVFLVLTILMAAVFLPTSFVLVIGLAPMFVAYFVDRTKHKTRVVTVGALNIAGCTPFIMELWTTEHTMEKAIDIIFDPLAIIVMYSAAGVGYIIDWAMTSLISSFLYNNALVRRENIEKRQKELEKRWGEEVNGTIPLDDDGFPLRDADAEI